MDHRLAETWFAMPVDEQISNIGSEVSRAIKWKNKNNEKRKEGFCAKAIEFLSLSIQDPKNKNRTREFENAINELIDYFYGNNVYGTTDEVLKKYYDAFLYRKHS